MTISKGITRVTSRLDELAATELERRGYKVLRLNKDSSIRGIKCDYIIIDEYAEVATQAPELKKAHNHEDF